MGLNRQLFGVFFRIGVGTIGGGYAMVPMMEHEIVDKRGWLSKEEFLDILAVSQTAPGVFAVNMSSYIGHKLGGVPSAIVATVGNVLPSYMIILAIAIFFRVFKDNIWVEYAFMGLRPVVVALIAVPVFTMARSASLSWRTCWIPILAASLIYLLGVSPVYVILSAGLLGLAYGWFSRRDRSM